VILRLALAALVALNLYGDKLTLANGDTISGRVQKLADGKLLIQSDMAGPITIPWERVLNLVSSQPVYVVLRDGNVLAGTVSQSASGLRIENSRGQFDIVKSDVAAIRSYEEELAYRTAEGRKLDPHFFDPWSGYADTGLSATRGNAETTTISVGVNGVRSTAKDKLTFTFNSLYSRNNRALPSTTANIRRGGARYEANLNAKQFAFISADAEFDEAQKLDLRTLGGAGFGHHVIKSPRSSFDLFAGGTANREIFATGLRRITAEALLSEESSHRLNSILTFRQKFVMYPNLTDTGEFRFSFDSSAITTLMRWLSWQVSVSDRHISDPLPGTLPNDLLLTTGFRFNLPQKR
jgi:putative salt-induced outer membrane protein